MHPLTHSCFLLLPPWKLTPLALHLHLGTFLQREAHSLDSTLCSFSAFPLCSRPNIPFSCQDVAFAQLDSFDYPGLVIQRNGSVPIPFGKGSSGILTNRSHWGAEATLSYSAGPVSSSFSDEACTILQAP